MLSLRLYKEEDATIILSWFKDEVSFRKWSANIFDHYPLNASQLNEFYLNNVHNMEFGVIPMIMCDESHIVGHLFFRPLDAEKKTIRFGFVVVDDSMRGKGYGNKMLHLAKQYVVENYGTKRLTLGVFENNQNAYKCYKSVGFKDTGSDSYMIMGDKWGCIEMELII